MKNMSNADMILKYKELLDCGAITEEEYQQKKEYYLNAPESKGLQIGGMDINARTTGIIAYLTWVGFIIAVLCGDREGAKFHLNQALVINLFAFLAAIPVLGWIWAVFILVFWVKGILAAYREEEKPVPIIGGIRILN